MAGFGVLDAMGYIQKQGEMGRERGQENRLAQLSQQAYGATGQDRIAALGQMEGVRPGTGLAYGDKMQQQDDGKAKRYGGAARYLLNAIKTNDPAAIQGAYMATRPAWGELANGKPIPDQYDEQMLPMLHQVIAASEGAGGGAAGNSVHSGVIGADGFVYNRMRDGSMVNTGVKADPRMQLRDHAGMAPELVDLRAGTTSPLMTGQPQAQGAPQGQPMPQQQGGGFQVIDVGNGEPPIDPRAVQAAAMNPGGDFIMGANGPVNSATGQAPPQTGGKSWSGNTPDPYGGNAAQPAAARPQSTSDALALQNYTAKQTRRLTPQEVAAAGYRPGTIVQVDGYGNEKVSQAPAADRAANSEADRKTINAAKAKVPQLQNAIRGMGRIDKALAALDGGMFNTGPLDQYAVRNLPAGQELEAAVGGIQNSFLALTRVPGIGSQSDLEARIASMQYPSLDKAPEVNKRTMENLKLFARDLAQAYEGIVSGGAAVAPAAQDKPAPGGWGIQRVGN